MYGLSTADWYDGYDTLNTDPTEGITSAFFDWRQLSVPITISRKEERQNSSAHRILDLLKSKITQAEIGIKEKFAKAFMQGAAITGGNISDPDTSNVNGATGIDPLGMLVKADPTTSTVVGNINQNTSSWWRNQFKDSALTGSSKASDFLFEADHQYNNCAKGPGGPPNLIVCDQTTFEMWRTAYYQVYRRNADSDKDYPFENFKFNRARVVWDEFMPDVKNNSTTVTSGSVYFLNTKFLKVKYDKETNFINTPFVKPANQDAKVAHILWMGNLCISNRRKCGVWFDLPVTLAWTV